MTDSRIRELQREAKTDPSAKSALRRQQERATGYPDGIPLVYDHPVYRAECIVMTASTKAPSVGGKRYGNYGRIAVVELEPGWDGIPAMISERARGVRRIVETWETLYIGKTDRCAYSRALAEANELVQELTTHD